MKRVRALMRLLRAAAEAVKDHKGKYKGKKAPAWLKRAEYAVMAGLALAVGYEFVARPLLDNFCPAVPLLPSIWDELAALFEAFVSIMEEGDL
ncbi:hypothetical protein LJC46_02200 [Desulfovibrio sp. OttesenSCG-928-G15]|nr:hypothetical protein [Desulfovibrio sp. OttesenSCG-928-G15]